MSFFLKQLPETLSLQFKSESEAIFFYLEQRKLCKNNTEADALDKELLNIFLNNNYFIGVDVILLNCRSKNFFKKIVAAAKSSLENFGNNQALVKYQAAQLFAEVVAEEPESPIARQFFNNIIDVSFCNAGPSYGYKLWAFITLMLNKLGPSKILEFGGGRSTLTLADYMSMKGDNFMLYTVESSPYWISKIAWNLQESRVHQNTQLIYAPLKNNWYDLNALQRIPEGIDFILIDGPNGDTRKSRVGQNYILNIIKDNTIKAVVVDDVNRSYNLEFATNISAMIEDSSIAIVTYGWWQKKSKIAFVFRNCYFDLIKNLLQISDLVYEIYIDSEPKVKL